ncbi:carbonate dehydratase [Polynucleobacter sp. AP-Melu-500A-A1]|jgi:carbonic anhydrase|uniref:carbonate dehydratase n=1 Tax=Polynucleobacter sp. AP-Melu-500A-A1 TaxID=2576929 RepID=UPI001C0DEDF9|nr:carbonate dehydratase [Polynucleobacter sp. AP-Melu-500A-A1]MBU3629641.1 carbonate dehydratase [Polynucleobacter sp. AP-Melu-500A-A1]
MIMKNSKTLDHLFVNNREWADEMIAKDADFFKRLVNQQAPEYLWIGCADSRVPANDIVNLLPGELFVHRNVANVVVHTDLNCLSVIQFAIELLKVKHIVVVGHYGCAGVHAALSDRRVGLADNWLRHVKDVHQKHERYLGEVLPTPKRQDRLCELNVIEQVINVCETTIVQDAWANGQELTVHGWVYRLDTGLIKDLGMSSSSIEEMKTRYTKTLTRYDAE